MHCGSRTPARLGPRPAPAARPARARSPSLNGPGPLSRTPARLRRGAKVGRARSIVRAASHKSGEGGSGARGHAVPKPWRAAPGAAG